MGEILEGLPGSSGRGMHREKRQELGRPHRLLEQRMGCMTYGYLAT